MKAGGLIVAALLVSEVAQSATIYVSPTGAHQRPFTSWLTAATNIQAAIDVTRARPGLDTVIVTNGVYDTGGVVIEGSLTNRIAITNPVTVRSVNGPDVTFIVGNGPLGDAAVRCAYVGDGARLEGFTLTNGHTRASGEDLTERSGGGGWCEPSAVISNCVISGNSAYYDGGGTYGGTIQYCTISGNSASSGGGTYDGTVQNCTITGNSASSGGGTYQGTIQNCTISGNSASLWGGGAYEGTIQNCTISGNSASFSGGGAYEGTIQGCTISGNSAPLGGGAYRGTIQNCTISGNSASVGIWPFSNSAKGGGTYEGMIRDCTISGNSANQGGGTYNSNVESCTIVENSATGFWGEKCVIPGPYWTCFLSIPFYYRGQGGGTYGGGIQNGIVFLNSSTEDGANWWNSTNTEFTCTTPLPEGEGNIIDAPLFVDAGAFNFHLLPTSPCIDSGTNESWMGGAFDLDGSPRIINGTVDMGSYEYEYTPFHYVSPSGGAHFPFTSWATAATHIQDAIEAAEGGDTIWVTNGVYDTGEVVVHGTMTNRIAITKPINIRSVNGADNTFIVGAEPAVRCAYVGDGARLGGFTLTNGHTRMEGGLNTQQAGGGVWCEPSAVVSYCTIAGNTAGSYGGGVTGGTVEHCTLSGNEVRDDGGGTYGSTVRHSVLSGNSAHRGGGAFGGAVQNSLLFGNEAGGGGGARSSAIQSCTITGNRANYGGGTAFGTVQNSIVFGNTALVGGENYHLGTIDYTCVFPDPGGTGNITNDPHFVDAAVSDFRLLVTSRCIDVGANQGWMGTTTDLDGNNRIQNTTVDLGCYEFLTGTADSDGDGIDDVWELQYFPNLHTMSLTSDWDHDGFRDAHEFHAGTLPTDPSSYLGIKSASMNAAGNEVIIRWSSQSNKQYSLFGSTDLMQGMDAVLDEHLPATPPENVYTNTVEGVEGRYYSVGVEP